MDITAIVSEMRKHYGSGIKSSQMGFGKTPAILVVDFIEGFTNADSPLGGCWDNEINATAALLEEARRWNLPIVFTTVEYSEGAEERNLLFLKTPRIGSLRKGSKWIKTDARLEKRNKEKIITKEFGSAFFGTNLATELQVQNIDTIIISGCVTSGCVRASVVDAVQNGFRPIVVRETVGDRSLLAHEANLIDIQERYGDVVSLKSAMNYLRSL